MDELITRNPIEYLDKMRREPVNEPLRNKYLKDAEEVEYWAAFFKEPAIVIEPENDLKF